MVVNCCLRYVQLELEVPENALVLLCVLATGGSDELCLRRVCIPPCTE